MRRALLLVVFGWLPLALSMGIIPFTHHLRFGHGFGIEVDPVAVDLVRQDVLNAMGMGFLMQLVAALGVVASVTSLATAFGESLEGELPERRREALAFALRWLWLVPFVGSAGLAVDLVLWAAPSDAGSTWESLLYVSLFAPVFGLSHALYRGLRDRFEVGPFAAVAVVAVPLAIVLLVDNVFLGDQPVRGGGGLYDPWLPSIPAAAEDAADDQAEEADEVEDRGPAVDPAGRPVI